MILGTRSELTDQLIEAYCDWRTRCEEVRMTYRRLDTAPKDERPLASAAFHAALDREGSAAEAYAHHVRRVSAAA